MLRARAIATRDRKHCAPTRALTRYFALCWCGSALQQSPR